jgi:hypothetical protein
MLHCWKDRAADIQERFGLHSPEHIETYMDDFVSGTCMLEADHEGEHEFTPDSEIRVTFPERVLS